MTSLVHKKKIQMHNEMGGTSKPFLCKEQEFRESLRFINGCEACGIVYSVDSFNKVKRVSQTASNWTYSRKREQLRKEDLTHGNIS
jgi:hypothetical protein